MLYIIVIQRGLMTTPTMTMCTTTAAVRRCRQGPDAPHCTSSDTLLLSSSAALVLPLYEILHLYYFEEIRNLSC